MRKGFKKRNERSKKRKGPISNRLGVGGKGEKYGNRGGSRDRDRDRGREKENGLEKRDDRSIVVWWEGRTAATGQERSAVTGRSNKTDGMSDQI